MRPRDLAPFLPVLCLAAAGCLFEEARRDGARCSETGSCPQGQTCSSDGQCLYPCPNFTPGCVGNECGCGSYDRPDNGQSGGWRCLADGLCHFSCTTETFGGNDCSGYMNCDTAVGVCRPACTGPEQCAAGAACVPVPNLSGGNGDSRPPNYCVGGPGAKDGGAPDGEVPDGGVDGDAGGPATGYQVSTYGTGSDPVALAVGSLTGGLGLDVVVAARGPSELDFFRRDEAGGLAIGDTAHVGARPFWVAMGQIDYGGQTDVAVLHEDDLRLDVRLGDGGGSINYVWQPDVLPWLPSAAMLAPIDYSGMASLVAVSYSQSKLIACVPDGSGRLVMKPEVSTPGQPLALAAADVDGDGRSDVVLLTQSSGGLHLMQSQGDGDFASGGSLADLAGTSGGTPVALVAGFFLDTSNTDFAVALEGHGTDAIKIVYHWLGPDFSIGGIPEAGTFQILFTGDFDGDGRVDLGALEQLGDQTTDVVIFRNNGDRSFDPGRRFKVDGRATAAAAGYFNHDGCEDIVVTLADRSQIALLASVTCPPWSN